MQTQIEEQGKRSHNKALFARVRRRPQCSATSKPTPRYNVAPLTICFAASFRLFEIKTKKTKKTK